MAQLGATWFSVGGVIALILILLPEQPSGFSESWFWLVAIAALGGAGVMVAFAGRIPVAAMHLIVPGGAVLISVAVYHGGSWGSTIAVFYMTGTYPFTFFRRNVALAYVAFMALAYAVVLAISDTSDADVGRWVIVIGTLIGVGVGFNWLVDRLESVQLELDELNRTLEERVAIGLHDLAESRRRVVAAGDAERRRIERNLHDGAQQHLVALAVKLRLVEMLAESDPAQAAVLVGEARRDVLETVDEVRTLAHGLYPTALADLGLAAALASAGGRSPLDTRVEAESVGRYDRDIEAAVYFCCLEAMQNAAKHAGDRAQLTVRLHEADGMLRFSVCDDGAGFTVGQHGGGDGLVNMADRLGAWGGCVAVRSEPGRGTCVSGEVPVLRTDTSRLGSAAAPSDPATSSTEI